jgi:hypothetical protein
MSLAPLDGYAIYDPVDPYENQAGPFHWRHREEGGHHFVLMAESRHCNRFGIVHGGRTLLNASAVQKIIRPR